MIKEYFTPQGKITKELTDAEVIELAAKGDGEAKKELYKKAKKDTIEERVKALEDLIK